MKIRKFLGFSFTLLWFAAGTVSLDAGQTVLPVKVEGASAPIVLGQDHPVEKKGIGLGERFKRLFINLTKDGENGDDALPANSGTKPPTASIPTKPPKPPTAAEVQQAVEHPEKSVNDRRSTVTTQEPQSVNNRSAVSRERESVNSAAEPEESESSVFQRLKEIRMQVFDRQTLRENRNYQELYGERNGQRSNVPAHSSVPNSNPARIPAASAASETAVPNRRTPPPEHTTLEDSIAAEGNRTADRAVDSVIEKPLPLNVRESANSAADNTVDNGIPYSPYRQEHSPLQQMSPLSGVDVNPGLAADRKPRNSVPPYDTALRPQTEPKPKVESYDEHLVASRRVLPSDTKTDLISATHSNSAEKTPDSALLTEKPAGNAAGSPSADEHPLNEPVKMQDSPVSAYEGEKKILVSPRLEVETECPPKAIVGQEAIYRIRAANRGGASAEQVMLSVEIPDWLEILQPDVSAGTTSIVPRSGQKEPRDFVWKISRIEPNAEELLVLHLIPQQRRSVDLRIRYDFYRPQAIAKIVVQEPVIEMELQGPDEVVWGNKVQYKLVVRNTGNGDAENILLELLQTGSDMRTCPLPVLKAGEEQPIEVLVWTGKQEHIDINIQATGEYGLKTNVTKRVKVLRPNVMMTVEAPSIQFVGNSAEFQIKVLNEGEAAANELILSATLPLGAQFVSCSEGGELTPENQIQWKVESIPVGEVFNASVVCLPKREGNCKLETAVSDKSGTLAQCSGSLDAQAIVDLKLDVEYPHGPVEVGSEAVYIINIINRGMKTAENVEVTTAFADGVEPKAVEGTNAYMNDGQVFFDKITTMAAGQKTVLKIKTKADKPGNHRVRTVVVCKGANINLVNEQATYFYQKQKEKSRTFLSNEVPAEPKPDSSDSPKQDVNRSAPGTETKTETKVAAKPAEVKPETPGKQTPLDPTQPLPQLPDPFLK